MFLWACWYSRWVTGVHITPNRHQRRRAAPSARDLARQYPMLYGDAQLLYSDRGRYWP